MEGNTLDNRRSEAGIIPKKQRPHLLFGLSCVVILTLFVAGYYQSSSSVKSLFTLREYSRQQDAVDNLLIDLLNAETGVRGYLITGKTEYLEGYASSVATLETGLQEVVDTVEDVSHLRDEITRLSRLAENYKSIFQALIENKTLGERVDVFDMYQGKMVFEEMRQLLSEIKAYLTLDSSLFYSQASTSQEYTRWAIFALCAAAFVFLIWLFSTLQKQVELRKTIVAMLARENEVLDREVMKRTQELTRLAEQLTRVSEIEKQRLARELHDDMGASLTAAKMDASWVKSEFASSEDETMQRRVRRLIDSLDDAITLKRRLTSDLLPPLLTQLGLFEALRSLAEGLREIDAVQADVDVPDELPELSHDTALAIFRIAQEALTNVRKYSHATIVTLHAYCREGVFYMEISDNGVGFSSDSVGEECFGLVSMRHRAHMIGANFTIDSNPGKGTRIKVNCPLEVANA